MQTIVETQAFAREANSILEDEEIDALKDFLAENPEAGGCDTEFIGPPETSLGPRRTRQTWRRSGHLLLLQLGCAAVSDFNFRQESKVRFESAGIEGG